MSFGFVPSTGTPWRVRRCSIVSELSQVDDIRVELVGEDMGAVDALLGAACELTIACADRQRAFHGIVDELHDVRSERDGVHACLRMVPAFGLLGDATGTNIFQNRTPIEILRDVLEPALRAYGRELDVSTCITREHRAREFCAQLCEPTLAFCTRLMAEEGIAFVFAPDGTAGRETLVLVDDPQRCPLVATDVEIRSARWRRTRELPEPSLTGHSDRVDLRPGARITIDGRELLVTRVAHTGDATSGALYRNELTATTASHRFTTTAPPPPGVHGLWLARVVGPKDADGELATDSRGRIAVQFPDAQQSAWIRLMRPWGAAFTPRVGSDVVVQFVDGDPNRPLVVGSLDDAPSLPRSLELRAREQIEIAVGSSSIRIAPDGVDISAEQASIAGTWAVTVTGAIIKLN